MYKFSNLRELTENYKGHLVIYGLLTVLQKYLFTAEDIVSSTVHPNCHDPGLPASPGLLVLPLKVYYVG